MNVVLVPMVLLVAGGESGLRSWVGGCALRLDPCWHCALERVEYLCI